MGPSEARNGRTGGRESDGGREGSAMGTEKSGHSDVDVGTGVRGLGKRDGGVIDEKRKEVERDGLGKRDEEGKVVKKVAEQVEVKI
jgi:hypothetical protein